MLCKESPQRSNNMYSHCTTKCQYAVRVTPVSIPILNDAVSEEGGRHAEGHLLNLWAKLMPQDPLLFLIEL